MATITTYISHDDADTYLHDNVFGHAWHDADKPTRERALRHATRIIDACRYKFTSESSEHAFPLTGQAAVPLEVCEACADIALSLLEGQNPEEIIESLEIIKHQIGPVSLVKDPRAIQILQHRYLGIPSFNGYRKLSRYLQLEAPQGSTIVRI